MITLNSLKLNPKNPRLILTEQFDRLVKSIEEFPKMMALRPIIIDDDGTILGGNMRFRALQKIGYQEVPDEWVRRAAELTPEEKRRFVIADNVENGEWDYEILANEWDDLPLKDWGLQIDKYDIPGPMEGEDDVPENIETICKPGDLWLLGNHRLVCGDSTKAADVAKLMAGEKADMVFTDPPYGVNYEDKIETIGQFTTINQRRPNAEIQHDDINLDLLFTMLLAAFRNAYVFGHDHCTYYITAAQGGGLGLKMLEMMDEAGLPIRHILIWNKNQATFSLGRLDYNYKHEPILYTWKVRHEFYGKGEFKTTVWDIGKEMKCDLHPTMKPVALIENALLNSSLPGHRVLDLFLGSGSTMIACEKLGRACLGLEIDPHYCDVAIQRWEKFTARKARRFE